MWAYSRAFWKHHNNIAKQNTVADLTKAAVVLLQPPKIAFTHPYSSETLNFIFLFVILKLWLCGSRQQPLLFTD